jgi:iron complex transport system permease protein
MSTIGVLVGPAGLDPVESIKALLDRLPGVSIPSSLSPQQEAILFELRLPRVVLGGLVGTMLALAGGAYQGVFRNPLADPYLLGAAAGAGLGATAVIAADGPRGLVPLAAFAGAMGAVALTYAVGRSVGERTSTTLILAGVAVASFLAAAQTFVLQRNSDSLQEVYGFILGSLATVGWSDVALAAPYALIAGVGIILHRRMLDVLAVGDEEAMGLGVSAPSVRARVVLAASLSTAAAVAVSGLIGFVGIIVPHLIRMTAGVSYRIILPLAILVGAAFLIGADVVGRTVLAPAELPIGVVTAFLGAPFFLLVLRTSRSRP